ncbi:MAG: YggS family pyridoxal phosphate-dependent enzyme [Pseudomonadota bacterium]
MDSEISRNIKAIFERIDRSARKAQFEPNKIKLVAVSKTKSPSMIKEAYDAGLRDFGENYAQELRDKSNELSDLDINWHFIGHLQKNKAKYIAKSANFWQSLDSFDVASEVNKRLANPIDVLIEVNLGGEASKTGVSESELPQLIENLQTLDKLNVKGLMVVPPYDDDPEKSRPYFKKLNKLAQEFQLKELSMGMTHDFEVAIEEGATIVRVGTRVFGERTK